MAVMLSVSTASAWFDGSAGQTNGPDGYKKTDLNLTIGSGDMWVRGALMRQDSDNLINPFNTYSVRVGKDAEVYTLAGEAGMTPSTEYSTGVDYSNVFVGGDITFSLTPSAGGKGRLAGPNAKVASGGGQGVARIDIGAGLKYTSHKVESATSDLDAAQTEYSVFAGAKILMARLGASWTGYSYDDKANPIFNVNPISGQAMAIIGVPPKSSVNFRLDLPGYPMVTPFASYTTTKFNGTTHDMNAYGVGAYIDLNLVGANVMYQVLDDGTDKDGYVALNAGIKF